MARFGEPSRCHLDVWSMVKAIDEANGNDLARSIYRRLYIPLAKGRIRHLECDSLDEAIAIAARHPQAHGGKLELRPFWTDED